MPSSRRLVSLVILAGAATAGIALACIIPDTEIEVISLDANANPVRIIEGIPLGEEARCACSKACECPIADQTGLPTFLDPSVESYQFCVCGENRIDAGRLSGTRLFAEDQDGFEGTATDELYAALLLDWSPTLGEPASDYVAYATTYVDPSEPLDTYTSSYDTQTIKRPRPFVRSIDLTDDSQRFDLCNGAGRTLAPGFHTLTLMVTDRPWFQTSGGFDDATSEDGPEPMPLVLEGVPNIAEGATYDIETYVFHCFAEGEDECQCETPPEP
jgi:hypothetical protein